MVKICIFIYSVKNDIRLEVLNTNPSVLAGERESGDHLLAVSKLWQYHWTVSLIACLMGTN